METIDTKPKILYVDDEEDNLHVFRSSFRRHYDIITGLSAKEGIVSPSKTWLDNILEQKPWIVKI